MTVPADAFKSETMARTAQALLNRCLSEHALMATKDNVKALRALEAAGFLEGRRGEPFRVVRMPERLCRRCYLQSSRALRASIGGRPAPEPSARQKRLTAKLEREAVWRDASLRLGLEPPSIDFECPECGRLEQVIHADEARARVVAGGTGLKASQVEQLLSEAQAGLRPAYLQRKFRVTYEVAVEALDLAVRLGLLDQRGRELVRAPAKCGYCYERRHASLHSQSMRDETRDPIPKQLRFKVLQRDGFRCIYCGRGAREGAVLHLDHVVPVAAGGETSEDNLVTACDACNMGKSTTGVI